MTAPAPRRVEFRLGSGLVIVADAYGDPSHDGAASGPPSHAGAQARPGPRAPSEPSTPTVLFLHGGGQTRHAWGGAARALANAGFHALTMDLRGHGESGWAPDGDYSTDAFVDDLRGVLEQLPAKPFLVGASLGGLTAMTAEGSAPEPVSRGVVLVDVTPRLEIQGVLRVIGFMRARPEGFASLEEAADAIADYLPHRRRPKDLAGLEKNLRRGDDGRYRWHWDPKLMDRWNPERWSPDEAKRTIEERNAIAKSLRVPVLLVRGRMSDVVSEEVAREFLALVPHAKYVDLAAGHMVAGDSNDAFTDAVLAFLNEHRGRP